MVAGQVTAPLLGLKCSQLKLSIANQMSSQIENQAAIELDEHDLPAACPNKKMVMWSSHPKVYLDVTTTGQAKCPYCGTEYKLKPGTVLSHHH